MINFAFAQRARDMLEGAGFTVDYAESEAAHNIEPHELRRAASWLASTLP